MVVHNLYVDTYDYLISTFYSSSPTMNIMGTKPAGILLNKHIVLQVDVGELFGGEREDGTHYVDKKGYK